MLQKKVLKNHLSIAGYQVTQAHNGPDALRLVLDDRVPFDMVLLDIMMPRMSGYEVCQKLREKFAASELSIIKLTAKNRVSDLLEGFSCGANDYLSKPFSKDELLTRIKTHLNLQHIHRATQRFVPVQFLKSIGRDSITEVSVGDHTSREVTVFFSDIRGYTKLAEQMTPEQNFNFVNAYLSRMGPIIGANQGFVNQYLGDAIMAIFTESSESAVKAAVEMQHAIREFNKDLIKNNESPIEVGMGFHSGPLIMGIIGDANRSDAATISDTVNMASRMEGLTKFYGARILISESSYNLLSDQSTFHFRYLGKVQVKGKQEAFGIYECIDGDTAEQKHLKLETLNQFKEGLNHFFDKAFPKATHLFNQVLEANPGDKVAEHFYRRSARYILDGVPEDWVGVEVMESK